MGILKQEQLEKEIICQFESCRNKAETSITDRETLQEVSICLECDDMLVWDRCKE